MDRNFELDAVHEIFKLADQGIADVPIAESEITTIFYILRKEIKINRLSASRELCKTINVLPFSNDILYFPIEKFKNKEDGLLYFLASKAKIDYLHYKKCTRFYLFFPFIARDESNQFFKRN